MTILLFILGTAVSFVIGAAYGYQMCIEHFKQLYAQEVMRLIEEQRKKDNEDQIGQENL